MMWQRFSERARRVVFYAQEEAARLGENYVGTEHLLLGICREPDSAAARMLDSLNVSLGAIRAEIERQVTRRHGNLGQDMQLTPRAKRVIDLAYAAARGLNDAYIGTEHLLLGLADEGDGLAALVLATLGATRERLAEAVTQVERHMSTPGEPSRDPVRALTQLAGLGGSELRAAHIITAHNWARHVCAGVHHLRGVEDLSPEQARVLLDFARVLKLSIPTQRATHRSLLAGRTLGMIFEKPSLRTRVSFEAGMHQLGGHALYLQPSDIRLGQRESVADVARVLSRMVDGIMARVFAHATIQELAEHSRVPVINGLCDREHPCQALADLLTIEEHRGPVAGQRVAYVGDGNNVAHSLLLLGAKLGAHLRAASPPGYAPDPAVVTTAEASAAASGGSVALFTDPLEACDGADVIYTDVWTSMGQEAESAERRKVFAPYQVNQRLVAAAKPDYLFLHCLPAHRGEEVSAEVADGPHSVLFDQAENRLHAQKAVLATLMGG